MQLRRLLVGISLSNVSVAFNLFNGPDKPVDTGNAPSLLEGLKVNELLVSNSRKPEFYNKAMLELKRIQEEPICHRLAAQLLMNTCRGLQDVNEQTLQFEKAKLQRNHVESFAAALTLCDMEGVNWAIPESCTPLSSFAMQRTIQEGKNTLVVAPDQVQACLTTLSQDHTHWMTWLHRRDSALLFCRVASIDMEKGDTLSASWYFITENLLDQLFESQKMLVKIMADFASELGNELRHLKENMAEHGRDVDKFFDGFMDHAERLKSKFQGTMNVVSKDLNNVASSIASVKTSGADIQRFLQNLFQTAVEGNAEMAAKHEEALAVSTTNVQTRLANINEMAERTESYAVVLGRAIDRLSSRLETMADQQEVMGQRSEAVLTALANATDLFQEHAIQLEHASITASKIHADLGNVATITKFASGWAATLNIGGYWGDWLVRVVAPPCTMVIGSYGLAPSLIRNVALFSSGVGVSEAVIYVRHWSCGEWRSDSITPSASTQLAREHIDFLRDDSKVKQSSFEPPLSSEDNLMSSHLEMT
ncbi:hypothetical protein BJ875DRAFT_483939 [Amylocarpus encephaloides]|uniref:Nuclear fusion protein KAR5 n=1 Tax=Amylocarpus encephaloides TaxID=45428 RepID=A0A9P7YJL0_9HELO|nr:hypothetical protein BJ875DRAFT_483939 [Amylocarpus encephaloides]